MNFREMTIADYDSVMTLLSKSAGVRLRDADSREATGRYLVRNPGLSFVATDNGGEIVGCIISGHDGRRGYLQHLAVAPACARRGIASKLVECCLAKLRHLGIHKSHVDVLVDNASAMSFWETRGWKKRTDIVRYSFTGAGENC